VVIEAVSAEKKVINPNGLAFLYAAESASAAGSVAQLQSVLNNVGVKAADVLRVSCFLSSLDDVQAARAVVATSFPSAVTNFLQMQRLGLEQKALCEAVARWGGTPVIDRPGSGVALINSPKIVLTATQLVFRDQDSDFRLAYQRVAKTLLPLGASFKDVFWTGTYALTKPDASKLESIQWEFLDRASPPPHTALQIEGLPSTDATAAVEVMAISR
jgi:enamine deaminase RidA (YjgF/YER057c/UK114 family)